jgi:hypothetical protein
LLQYFPLHCKIKGWSNGGVVEGERLLAAKREENKGGHYYNLTKIRTVFSWKSKVNRK